MSKTLRFMVLCDSARCH